MLKSRSIQLPFPGPYRALPVLFSSAALLLTLLQDRLHAAFHHYPFFLSEALIFGSFWLIFLPLLYTQLYFLTGRSVLFRIGSVFLCTGIHLLSFPLAVYLLSALLLAHTYAWTDTFLYTVSGDVYKCILIYGPAALLSAFIHKQGTTGEAPAPVYLKAILTGNGRFKVQVPAESILCISSASPYVRIHTAGKDYLHTTTLKQLGTGLDPALFQRVHRSAILNIAHVRALHSRLNGDYDVHLSDGSVQRLSRNYAAAFKKALSGYSAQTI
ncbi:MAG: LytTR family DNA-binding domain-containing protein [Flavobacteriales bacterium]